MPFRPGKVRLQVSLRETLNWIITDTFSDRDLTHEEYLASMGDPEPLEFADLSHASGEPPAITQLTEALTDGEITAIGVPQPAGAETEHEDFESVVIPPQFWRCATVDWDGSSASNAQRAYKDIRLQRDDVMLLWKLADPESSDEPASCASNPRHDGLPVGSSYTTPYLELMRRAIEHFEMGEPPQPLKKELTDWFLGQSVDGKRVSRNLAKAMATLVRLPESQRGGIRQNYRRKNTGN